MIIARSPLRITLGGGGTDIPSYYRKHGGYVISAAIDKLESASINERFDAILAKPFTKKEFLAVVQAQLEKRIRS